MANNLPVVEDGISDKIESMTEFLKDYGYLVIAPPDEDN